MQASSCRVAYSVFHCSCHRNINKLLTMKPPLSICAANTTSLACFAFRASTYTGRSFRTTIFLRIFSWYITPEALILVRTSSMNPLTATPHTNTNRDHRLLLAHVWYALTISCKSTSHSSFFSFIYIRGHTSEFASFFYMFRVILECERLWALLIFHPVLKASCRMRTQILALDFFSESLHFRT